MFTILKILKGNNLDDDFPNITPGCDVERSFSRYKNLLRSNRWLFTFESLKHHCFM